MENKKNFHNWYDDDFTLPRLHSNLVRLNVTVSYN